MKTPAAPLPLTQSDRDRLERHHSSQAPRLFEDNFPWDDTAFTRRFTELTDLRQSYWGDAAPDVDRLALILDSPEESKPHVVDLCCGAGRHSLAMAARGWQVTGLDISPYAVRRARGKAAAKGLKARFIASDVLAPPRTEPAQIVALLCEQIVNFSPRDAAALLSTWSERLLPGGAWVVEIPTELPPSADDLYWMEEPLFLSRPCWVRYTQRADPDERTLLETFTCLSSSGEEPRSFFNSRRYYRADDLASLAPACNVQVIEVPARAPRLDLEWLVFRG